MEGRDYPARMLPENRSNYAPAREKLVVDNRRERSRDVRQRANDFYRNFKSVESVESLLISMLVGGPS